VSSEKNLLVEVHVATDDGRQEESFTGYPVAPARVLTARHGLLPKVPAARKTIEVRWHHQTGKKRCWRKAKIEWQNDKLDAAILSCKFPPGVDDFGWVCDWKPGDEMDWYGDGIARAGDKDADTSGAFAFKGGVYSAADTAARFAIGISDECDDPTWYKGASGMPVFVKHRIIGIAVCAGGPAQGRRFKASPAWRMLENSKFRQAIGHDEREERRREAHDSVTRLLSPAQSAPFCRHLAPALRADPHEPAAVTAALFRCDLDTALSALYQALEAVGPGEQNRNRTLACELLGQILPMRFDPGAIEGTAQRCDRPDALCLELPAGVETVAEVIMAGVRARPAYFKDLQNRELNPVGRDALSPPPYTGFDSGNKAYESNVHADLCNRLLQGDEDAFDAFMIDEILDPAERAQRRGARWSQEDLKKRVASEMAIRNKLSGARRRRYYFLFEPGIDAVQVNRLPALKNLRSDYRLLDFVALGNATDVETVIRECERFALLREILPSSEENPR
jgi:hypothetical protein